MERKSRCYLVQKEALVRGDGDIEGEEYEQAHYTPEVVDVKM